MSEAKMKMDEKEFFRAIDDWCSGTPAERATMDLQYGALASRLGIELTREEEPKGCPFCGCENVLFEENRILCLRCGTRGAFGSTKAQAIAAWNRRHQPPPEKIIAEEELAKRMFNAVNPGQDWINSLDKHSRERPWKTAARAALRALGLGIPEEEGEDSEEWSTQYMTPAPPSPKTTPGEVHLFDGDDMKTLAIPTREELAKEMRKAYFVATEIVPNADTGWDAAAAYAFRAFGLEPRKEEDHGA